MLTTNLRKLSMIACFAAAAAALAASDTKTEQATIAGQGGTATLVANTNVQFADRSIKGRWQGPQRGSRRSRRNEGNRGKNRFLDACLIILRNAAGNSSNGSGPQGFCGPEPSTAGLVRRQAALAFDTWVAMASINAGDRQS